MSILRVKCDTIARVSLPAKSDAAFEPGDLVKYDANGVALAGAGVVAGMVMESKVATSINPAEYGATAVTVVRGPGLISTDEYEGAVVAGNQMVINPATSKLKVKAAETTPVIAIALGPGTATEVDFLLTGDM
ncbi:MAG: hypothetical protein M1343_08420 [Chloroflexi bacterium]|nr:hypothetical protein [Chloroflexota bacterium]